MTNYVSGLLLSVAFSSTAAFCQVTPAFVQGTAFLDTTFSATAVSATFPATPAAGNAIIVGCLGDGGSSRLSPGGVTDNQSNTYKQVVFQNYIGSGQPTALYIATNIASAGVFTVTCAGVDQVDAIDMFAVEYSGLANAGVVDSVSAGVPSSGDYPRLCGSVTTSAPNALIVALFNNDANANPAAITPTAGYALFGCVGGSDGTCSAQDGSRYQLGAMIGGLAQAPGTSIPGFASGPSGANSQSICVVAAFRAR